MAVLPFDDYVQTLSSLTAHVDPTASSPEAEDIKSAARSLGGLPDIDAAALEEWVRTHPRWVPVLGIAIGLSRERVKNVLRDRFGTAGWATLAQDHPEELVAWLDLDYNLVRAVAAGRARKYDFGDVLVARAGTRATAKRATVSGRQVEDEIEKIAGDLGLQYETRTRFEGRHGRTAPCDLVVPSSAEAAIVVAAKGFDSTGSKLSDAVREIEEMADVRRPDQYVMAVIDGIGWKGRIADLRRIHTLWATHQIDGMYTLGTLATFRKDLKTAAQLRQLT